MNARRCGRRPAQGLFRRHNENATPAARRSNAPAWMPKTNKGGRPNRSGPAPDRAAGIGLELPAGPHTASCRRQTPRPVSACRDHGRSFSRAGRHNRLTTPNWGAMGVTFPAGRQDGRSCCCEICRLELTKSSPIRWAAGKRNGVLNAQGMRTSEALDAKGYKELPGGAPYHPCGFHDLCRCQRAWSTGKTKGGIPCGKSLAERRYEGFVVRSIRRRSRRRLVHCNILF